MPSCSLARRCASESACHAFIRGLSLPPVKTARNVSFVLIVFSSPLETTKLCRNRHRLGLEPIGDRLLRRFELRGEIGGARRAPKQFRPSGGRKQNNGPP